MIDLADRGEEEEEAEIHKYFKGSGSRDYIRGCAMPRRRWEGAKWLTWLPGERRRREKYTNVLNGLAHEIT